MSTMSQSRHNWTEAHNRLSEILSANRIPFRMWQEFERPGEFNEMGRPKIYQVDCLCWDDIDAEADGGAHKSRHAERHDAIRDKFFERLGIMVLRFPNKRIFKEPAKVLEEIRRAHSR